MLDRILMFEKPEVSDVHDPLFLWGTRVFMNGRDISDRCYRAEVYGGALVKAYLIKHDKRGEPYWDHSRQDVVREVRWGFGFLEYPCKQVNPATA